jgi:hypothetical protein
MDAPGSRIGLCPGGQGRGGRLRGGVPGHGRLPDSGPLDDPGLVPISGPGSRSRTPAASGSSWPGFPPPALSAVTGDRFRRQDDGPRAACTCGRRCQRHGNPEDPVGGRSGSSGSCSRLRRVSAYAQYNIRGSYRDLVSAADYAASISV